MKILLNSTAVEYANVSTVDLFSATAGVTVVSFEVILNPLPLPNIINLTQTIRSQGSLGSYDFIDYGIVGIAPSGIIPVNVYCYSILYTSKSVNAEIYYIILSDTFPMCSNMSVWLNCQPSAGHVFTTLFWCVHFPMWLHYWTRM